MAKKRSASGLNMAAEIRSLLEANRALTGKQVYEALKKKFPRQDINESSCGVAFSGARKKLGISPNRRGKKRKTAKTTVVKMKPAATALTVDLAALQAAAKFVSEVGDAEKAIASIRQLRSLQIQ
jgi:hypothetical protein